MQDQNSTTNPAPSTQTSSASSSGTQSATPKPTLTEKAVKTGAVLKTEILSGSMKANTVKYEVHGTDFGVTLKGPVYLMQTKLLDTFGHLPKRIRITVEEVEGV